MLALIGRLFRGNRAGSPAETPGGEAGRREVYAVPLPDGVVKHYDPFALRISLNRHDPKWFEKVADLSKLARPLPAGTDRDVVLKRAEEHACVTDEVAELVSKAFSLPRLSQDGSGYTTAELVRVMTGFLSYISELMEKTLPLASTPATSG